MLRAVQPVASIVFAAAIVAAIGACRDVIDLRTPPGPASPAPRVTTPTPTPPTTTSRFEVLLDDPLGDGSRTATLFVHDGLLWIGPSADGAHAVRVGPLGDVVGTTTFSIVGAGANHAASVFPSFGATGCQPNTLACGPDNESSPALLQSATLDGVATLVASGGKGHGGMRDVYFGTLDGDVATFASLDLDPVVGGEARGVSVVHDDGGGRIALGLRTKGSHALPVVDVLAAPTDGGENAQVSSSCSSAQGNVCKHDLPGLKGKDVDTVASVAGFTYVASARGVVRTAGALADAASFDDVTPDALATSSGNDDAEGHDAGGPPSSRAIVGFAALGDGVVFGRNGDAGPEVWACASSTSCAAASWTQLTGFTGARVSAVVDNAGTPVIALDDATGIRLFEATTALDRVDGLGTQVLASQLVAIGGDTWLYALVADADGPARLARVLL